MIGADGKLLGAGIEEIGVLRHHIDESGALGKSPAPRIFAARAELIKLGISQGQPPIWSRIPASAPADDSHRQPSAQPRGINPKFAARTAAAIFQQCLLQIDQIERSRNLQTGIALTFTLKTPAPQ
jgi:hypothetical protein